LRRIAPEKVTKEDFDEIVAEKDLMKRAKLVIEAAKMVIGDKEACFVTAKDIVSGNPRLNMAFAVTLFSSHPALEALPPPISASRRKRTKEESTKVDIWIIGDGPGEWNDGVTISWDDQKAILKFKSGKN